MIRTNRKNAIEVTFTQSFLKAIHFEDYLASCASSSGPLDAKTIQGLALHRHTDNNVVPLMDRNELVELSEDFDLEQFLNLTTSPDTCGIEPLSIQAIESIRSVEVGVSMQFDHYLCLLCYYQNLYGDYFCSYSTLPSAVGNNSMCPKVSPHSSLSISCRKSTIQQKQQLKEARLYELFPPLAQAIVSFLDRSNTSSNTRSFCVAIMVLLKKWCTHSLLCCGSSHTRRCFQAFKSMVLKCGVMDSCQ